ncbi:MAG: low molecular weight protein arginine phosphatase [Clostridiaceae bacterium]|nr:low molecular weight protein arginine phosphatase [Clostridiaceae bacterium]
MKVLFVCTGNTCRSPMAEGIYNAKAEPLGLEPAESAGIFAVPGDPVTPNAVTAAAEYGADISAHTARLVTAELLAACDRIYCMTPSHRAALAARFPDCAAKCRLLSEQGIPDPYGGDPDCYRRTAAAIAAALDAVLREAQA